MAVAAPSPVKILSDLGYEIWDIESDADMRSALIEAINTLTFSNPSDGRIPVLQEAVKNIQRPRFKRKTVGVDKLFDRKSPSSQKLSPQKLLPGSADDSGQNINTSNLAERLDNISSSLNVLSRALKQQFNVDKQVRAQTRRDKDEEQKKERERELETKKGNVLGGTTKAISKPFAGFFKTLLDFFKNILLGGGILKVIDWLQDPANQAKMKAFWDFISKTLPEMIKKLITNIKESYPWWYAGFTILRKSIGHIARFLAKLPGRIFRFTRKAIMKAIRAVPGMVAKLFKKSKAKQQIAKQLIIPGLEAIGPKVVSKTPLLKRLWKPVAQFGKKLGSKVGGKAFGAIPGIGILWDLGAAVYRFSKGDITGGFLSLGSAIPVLGWGVAALDVAREFGAFEGTFMQMKKPNTVIGPPNTGGNTQIIPMDGGNTGSDGASSGTESGNESLPIGDSKELNTDISSSLSYLGIGNYA